MRSHAAPTAQSSSSEPPTPRQGVVRRALHGVLLLDKPSGMTSNAALQRVRWLLRAQKGGHTGTLDPLASGVLPLCFGAATKFAQVQLDATKSYVASVQLGVTTSTADREGVVLRSGGPIPHREALERALWAACEEWMGEVQQTPPMTSALKHNGQPLYALARAGIEVARPARKVFIHTLRFELTSADTLDLHVSCSKGTYVRVLAQDLGDKVGCGAHLLDLRRVATGGFTLEQCVSLQALESMDEQERERALLGVDALIEHFVRVELNASQARQFLNGMRCKVDSADAQQTRVYQADVLLGCACVQDGELIPRRVLSAAEVQQLARSGSSG